MKLIRISTRAKADANKGFEDMLRVADRAFDEDEDAHLAPSAPAPSTPAPRPAPAVSAPPAPASLDRYGARRGPNLPAILLIFALHAAAIAGLMQARHYIQKRQEARLSVVNLTPPPPPPAAETPPPPARPDVVAPPPIVRTPVAPSPVATTPDPVPVPSPVPVATPPAPQPAVFVPPMPPSVMQGGDLSARMVAGKPPRYPIESRRRHEQGTVILAITLGVDGAVDSIAIARSSGFARLDDAARDAVRRWRWRPTIQAGQPVRVKGVVEIPFILST